MGLEKILLIMILDMKKKNQKKNFNLGKMNKKNRISQATIKYYQLYYILYILKYKISFFYFYFSLKL